VNVIDGDPDTYWEPEPKDLFPPSYPKRFTKWWIEMDLGKLVNAVKVVLRFAEDGDPFRQFSVYISDGNMTPATYGKPLKDREFSYTYIEGTKRPVEGPDAPKVFEFYLRPTVRPGEGFAYTMSGQRADLVRYVRIVVTDWREGTHPRLADIEVWSTGDNIALGIIRRGGSFTESEGAPHRMVDGMLDTYWRASTWFPYRGPKPEDWAWVLIDLGGGQVPIYHFLPAWGQLVVQPPEGIHSRGLGREQGPRRLPHMEADKSRLEEVLQTQP